eukprot:TRINITY_DN4240_c2_g1_i1.p1 TRINITY_DN4240_c2_g1~~TRINITY_DN4240_c2_g1_i1.p1  ORF type:complete len:304 (+),score=42.74 TRINITY_DN4240_c2_g1_i1:43-912(+)
MLLVKRVVQKRFASKITTGGYKNKIMNQGRGGPLTKWYGWKITPGGMAETGWTVYKTQVSSLAVDDDDDEMPFNIYPGLNTVRDHLGYIKATVNGIVRISKLPGTEGTGEKVFVWIDPNFTQFFKKEFERHRHRANGNEFVADEIEDRFLRTPRWTRKEDTEQELPDWPKNPVWDHVGKKNYSMQPSTKNMKKALTERERYEQADQDMFYSRMANRTRSYSFGGINYAYENERLQEKPITIDHNGGHSFHRPTVGGRSVIYAKGHVRSTHKKERYRVYHVSDMFGTFWE